ncbi:MAG: diiron oxygenase, partial [Acidimicrobiales bacterium]
HVTEEARHLSFARQYLKREVPKLGWLRRRILADAAPLLLGTMARVMVFPSRHMVHHYGIPPAQLRQARRSAEGRRLLTESVAKPRRLCTELGLMTRPARALWKLMGVWEDPPSTGDTEESEAA